MSRVFCTVLVGAALTAVLSVGCVEAASADSIQRGDLLGVFANGGSFDTTETYTVVHFTTFAPSPPSVFPDGLAASGFPSAPFNPSEFFAEDAEFFLIGGLEGAWGDPDHLILSNASGNVPSNATGDIGDPLHDILVDGAFELASAAWENGPIQGDVSASDFWGLFGSEREQSLAQDFFFGGPTPGFGLGPVVQLNGFEFNGGSEDLFGFDPSRAVGVLTSGQNVGTVTFTNEDGETFAPVPEPASLVLLGSSLLVGLGLRRRRRRRRRTA